MSDFRHPEDRWEPWSPDIYPSGGPERVVTDEPHPDFQHRPIGFAPRRIEREPLLWEGDNA